MILLESPRPAAKAGEVLVFAGILAAFFLTNFFRVSASVVMPMLAEEWGMSAALIGVLSSMYFYTYSAMQPISGSLNDRFGPSAVVSAGLLVSAAGAMFMAYAGGPLAFGIGRLLTGLGLAPMYSGALVFQGATFDPARYSVYSGIILFVGNLGAVISVVPLQYALDRWGRPGVFSLMFLISVLLAAAMMRGRRFDRLASGSEAKTASMASAFKGIGPSFRTLFSSRPLLGIAAIWCASVSAITSLQGLWAVAWSRQVYGQGSKLAGIWATLIGIGVMSGTLVGAWYVSDRKGRRSAIALDLSLLVAAWAALLAGMYYGVRFWITAALCFIVGLLAGFIHTHLATAVNELSPKGRGGSVFGCVNMLIFSSVIITQTLTGVIITGISGGGGYSAEAFLGAFAMLWAVLLSSLAAIPSIMRDR